MTIRDEIVALTDPNDGMIHADSMVTWAKSNPNSELHQEFEWDDDKAANEYRLDQARRLIQIHVTYPDTGRRSVVSLTIDRSKGGGYRPLLPVLSNREMRALLIQQTLDEVARVLDRYPQLNELGPLMEAVREIRGRLEVAEIPLAAD